MITYFRKSPKIFRFYKRKLGLISTEVLHSSLDFRNSFPDGRARLLRVVNACIPVKTKN